MPTIKGRLLAGADGSAPGLLVATDDGYHAHLARLDTHTRKLLGPKPVPGDRVSWGGWTNELARAGSWPSVTMASCSCSAGHAGHRWPNERLP